MGARLVTLDRLIRLREDSLRPARGERSDTSVLYKLRELTCVKSARTFRLLTKGPYKDTQSGFVITTSGAKSGTLSKLSVSEVTCARFVTVLRLMLAPPLIERLVRLTNPSSGEKSVTLAS